MNKLTPRRLLVFLLIGVVAFLGFACSQLHVSDYYQEGIVVAVSPPAVEVGRQVFAQGGNAFDAAVAVGFALAVSYPPAGNIGGGGFAVVRDGASGEVLALDFRERAPLAATEDMYLDSAGEVISGLSTSGALACGVPGSVAGLHALWEKHGSLPWQELVTMAARLADTGFVVDRQLAAMFAEDAEKLSHFEETRALYMPDGRLPAEGDRLKLPDLAATLYLIAAEGPKAFYSGTIADKITAGVQKYGGLITNDDLESYRALWRSPIKFTFDSLDVYSMPPPSSGGILVGQILKLLEPYGFGSFSPESPDYIHLFCEAARLAYADRSRHLGDPDFWNVPSTLLDDDYLKQRRAKISLDHAGTSLEVEPGSPARFESEHTTHYSICDARGNMVSVTTTINAYFGGGLTVEGAGFLLNNEMDDFSIKMGYANLYGLTGSEANRIEPGKRMLSSMAPTLVLKHDRPYLILGSPGGSKIPTTVAEAILDVTRFGLTLEETVNQPRFHHQWLPDILYLEAGRFDVAVKQRLIRYGHQIEEREPIGDLEIVEIDPVTGLMSGASDPRRGGAVDGL